MDKIIRGTTPTLLYTFNNVNVSNITVAYLTLKTPEKIEKDLSEATVGEKSLAWTLTQAETLAFGNSISAMINWKTADGTRGASEKVNITVEDNYKDIEI